MPGSLIRSSSEAELMSTRSAAGVGAAAGLAALGVAAGFGVAAAFGVGVGAGAGACANARPDTARSAARARDAFEIDRFMNPPWGLPGVDHETCQRRER